MSSYCSILVVAAGFAGDLARHLQGKRAAFITGFPTGMNALRAVIAPLAEGGRFFAEIIETGAMPRALIWWRPAADVAAIDAVSLALFALYLRRPRPASRALPKPSAPSCLSSRPAAQARRVMRLRGRVGARPWPTHSRWGRQALLLRDIMLLPDSAYERSRNGAGCAASRLSHPS